MEKDGWVFNWNDRFVFAPGPEFCSGVPATSYCGFRSPNHGKISYTFSGSGTATFVWGMSWDTGSVHVRINNVEIASRSTRGTESTTFSYGPNDVLEIEELNVSVINIHSLTMTPGNQNIMRFYHFTSLEAGNAFYHCLFVFVFVFLRMFYMKSV